MREEAKSAVPTSWEDKVMAHLEALRQSMAVLLSAQAAPVSAPLQPANPNVLLFDAATALAGRDSETNGYGDI